MRCLAAGVVISLILINVALGDLSTQNTKFIYHMDQKVKGNGFFNSHGDTNTYDLQMSNNGHGSGSYDYESKVFAMKEAKYNEGSQNYDYDTRERQITMNESVDYAFSPIAFSFGKSFHSGAFKSLGEEETSIENYGEPISMVASFDSISTMSKSISANLYWKNTTTDATDPQLTELDYTDVLNTKMNIDAAFTGKAHIGVTGMDDIGEPTNPIKAPSVRNLITNNLIDEDYLGTFHIVKKMSQDSTYKRHKERDGWLPCCSSGFADMSPSDQKPFTSAKGIFDCTCFKAPSTAQWPRVYA